MNIITKFLETKMSQNILQNSPNCIILRNFLRGACSKPPLQTRG